MPDSARRPRMQRVALVAILAALLIASIVGSTAWLVAGARTDAFADRRRELENLALTLSEQTNRAFQSLQLLQDDLIDDVREEGIENRTQLAQVIGSATIHALLREKVSVLPYVDAITVIDDTGRLINFSRFWPIPPVNVADRDYFLALRDMSTPPIFISEPVLNRGTGTITIYFAHRFTTTAGAFLGLVLGALEQSYFERFYSSIRLGPSGMIALVRTDGALMARYPGSVGVAVRDAAVRARTASALFGAGFDGMLPAGTLDEKGRIAAVQPIGSLPLAVVVSDSAAAVAAVAVQRTMALMLASGLLCITIVLITYGLVRHMRNEHAFAEAQHAIARTDSLTGLANRLAFVEHLDRLLKKTEPSTAFALLFLDLDYFKSVNDTLGHDAGDLMLVEVAKRIRARLRPGDLVARLGGDEFAVLRSGDIQDGDALAFGQSILAELQMPFVIGQHRVIGGCSAGIVLSPRDGAKATVLMKNADLALYRAKSDGRGICRLFVEEMERTARERRQLELDLHTAWRERQFFVFYQPIFEAASGRLAGFEALLRWRHAERGYVPPDVFIPLAEETGLILPLGAWVLREACRTAMQWPRHIFISVNLSPIQFRGAQAFHQVRAALDHSGLPPERLEVEITESTLLQKGPMVRATLEQFSAEGITVALDDFGTGYSSLSYLRTLSIGRIKVDRSFVDQMEDSPQSLAIVRTIVGLARTLSLRCTAEGIETEGQRRLLAEEGCTHLQGYLLGRPASAEEALRLTLMPAA